MTLPEAVRPNNSTTGVCWKRNKWMAKITWKSQAFLLGSYDRIEEAFEARKGVETVVRENQSDVIGVLEAYLKTLWK